VFPRRWNWSGLHTRMDLPIPEPGQSAISLYPVSIFPDSNKSRFVVNWNPTPSWCVRKLRQGQSNQVTWVPSPTCVLLADHHTISAEGIRDLLTTAFDSVYVVGDVKSLHDGARRLQPTVVVLDNGFAQSNILELTRWIKKHSPSSKLIMLACEGHAQGVQISVSAGADAVVLKRCIAQDLLAAVDTVQHNERFISPEIDITV
jgi:CheY-like chemotaxis protein